MQPPSLAFVQGPSNTVAGSDITPAVTVAVEDANGNVETADGTTQVTLAIGTNPGGGTLGGGAATTVSSGVATFAGLSIDAIGIGYTLTASSSPSYTGAPSSAFTISGGQLGLSCVAPPLSPASPCQGIDLPAITLDGSGQMMQGSGQHPLRDGHRGLSGVGWSVSAYLMPNPSNPNVSCANVATFCNASVGSFAANPHGQIPVGLLGREHLLHRPSGQLEPRPHSRGPAAHSPVGAARASVVHGPSGEERRHLQVGGDGCRQIPPGPTPGKIRRRSNTSRSSCRISDQGCATPIGTTVPSLGGK